MKTDREYDYLIVGSRLFGATFAHEAMKRGQKCLVIDKRNHVGGNVYCENVEAVLDAGANIIVSGSGVFKGNITENTKRFMEILKRHE